MAVFDDRAALTLKCEGCELRIAWRRERTHPIGTLATNAGNHRSNYIFDLVGINVRMLDSSADLNRI